MTTDAQGRLHLLTQTGFLALAYAIAGWIGLFLIDPALHGVVIWPAAGVASGVLITRGRRFWPGILAGFVALHWAIAQGMLPGVPPEAMIRLGWAAGLGAVLQALVAATLVKRRLGLPVSLSSRRDIVALVVRVGPVACAVSATVGVAAAWQAGLVPAHLVAASWLKWWAGELVGVFIALPVVLYCRTRPLRAVLWKGKPISRPSFVMTAVGVAGLAVSIFVSASVTATNHEENTDLFTRAVDHSAALLKFRLTSLSKSLDAAANFTSISKAETTSGWHRFVHDTASKALASAGGLGFIPPRYRRIRKVLWTGRMPRTQPVSRSSLRKPVTIRWL